jgi:putative membrane protein
MFKNLLVVWLVMAIAIAVVAAIVPSIHVDGGVFGLLGVALIFGLVNAIVGPILRLVSAPLTLMTLGLFSLVVNAVLLLITAGISDNLDVGGFFPAVLSALLISIVAALLSLVVPRLAK